MGRLRFRQWLYPAPFRIEEGDPRSGLLVLELIAIQERIAALAPQGARPEPASAVPPPAPSGGVDKAVAIPLCNQLMRIERSAARAAQQGASEAGRLQGHLDRLRKSLEESGVRYEDLTGQAYDHGRSDFEPLGEPQARPELKWATIIQCECPVVRLRGQLAQKAKGIVGVPAQ